MNTDVQNFARALCHALEEMIEQPFDHDPGNREGLRMALDLVKMLSQVDQTAPPPHPMTKEYLQLAAKEVQARLPDNTGFFLFVAGYGEGKSRAHYVSTMERESAINAMIEFIIKVGAAEDWLKHLP